MDNEVIIHVRVKKDAVKQGFEDIGKESEAQSRKISESFSARFGETFRARFAETIRRTFSGGGSVADGSAQAGSSFGDRFGRAAAERISVRVSERIRRDNDTLGRMFSGGGDGGSGGKGGDGGTAKVDVNVDKQSLLSRLFGAGKAGAASFADGFKSSIGSFFSGDFVTIILKSVAVVGLATLLAPIVGAAFTSALGLALGGGALAVGIAGAFKDPRVLAAAKGALGQLSTMFADFSANFKGPVEEFFAPSNKGGGGIVGVLAQIKPMISQLGKDLAPVAQNLSKGIIGFLQNALPPIITSISNSRPIVDALADKLPKIGTAIGDFFRIITTQSPEASVFLRDLLDGIVMLIDFIGTLITGATSLYIVFRRVFIGIVIEIGKMAEAAAIAFGWVPGLGPKLQAANESIKRFVSRSNNNLKGMDKDVTINVRFRIVGQAAASAAVRTGRLLSSMGFAHGGITGAATGGLHSGMRMVGEHGPELVELPPGTRVNSNPDTERMMSGDGGGSMPPIVVQLVADGRVLAETMVEPMRRLVRGQGQGSVQGFLGQAGVA